jgi:hypothetical protein
MDEKALADYFEFDEYDLAANRNGRLSERQRRKLVELDKGSNPILIGLALFFLAVASIFPLVFKQVNPGTVIWVLIWGGLGCYVLYCLLFPSATPISKIIVKKVEGPVHFVPMDGGRYAEVEYSFRIGKEKMEAVDHRLTDIMQAGDNFTVYFHDPKDGTGNHILSLEYLSKG